MERPPGMKLTKPATCIIVIILFHVVGLAGFMVPALQTTFLKLVPFHLMLMLAVVAISHEGNEGRFWWFAPVAFLLGFTAEWIGVHKQWIFGDYRYGATLGPKIFDIPLTIGVNWFVLIYCTGVSMARSPIPYPWLRILTGAIILVLLDLLIEPVAIRFDYWTWTEGYPPLKNYLGWLVMSMLLLYLFELASFKKQSIVGPVLILVQFIFFGILQLVV
jgi:bisanhydrobacterioruberin hydratase